MKALLHYLIFKVFLLVLTLNLICINVKAQSIPSGGGSYTIDSTTGNTFSGGGTGNFKSFTRAVAALNLLGTTSLSSTVIFTVTAGQTFGEAPVTITYANPAQQSITFTSSGVPPTNNPVLLGTNGTGTTDAVITISGGNAYAFNGINLGDNSTNITGTTEMEYGLWLNGLNNFGCWNNIYRYGTITLNKANTTNTCCVYVSSNATGAGFTNSNNSFFNNTVQNATFGYNFSGNVTYLDQNNQVGTLSGGTSIITNLGNGFAGIIYSNQLNFNVFNNSINGITNDNGTTSYAINSSSGTATTSNIFGNTIGADSGAITTTTGSIVGIYLQAGSANIYNNVVRNITASSNATVIGIQLNPTASSVTNNVYGNSITGLTTVSSGALYGIQQSSSTASITDNIYGNTISSLTNSSGALFGIYHSSGNNNTTILNIYNNFISTLSSASSTTYGINYASNGVGNIYSNTISFVSSSINSTTTGIYGINITSGNVTGLYRNYISSISSMASTSGPPVAGINYTNTIASTDNIYGNTVIGISASGTSSNTIQVSGIILGGTTASVTNNLFSNQIYNISNATTSSGSAVGLQISSTVTNNVYNNNIYDIRANSSTQSGTVATTGGGGGAKGIYISASAASNKLYYNTVYLNGIATSTVAMISSALYAASQASLDYRDNIFINDYIVGSAASKAYGFWYNNTIYTGLVSATTNNNFLYSNGATIGTQYYIFVASSNTAIPSSLAQTLTTYKGPSPGVGTTRETAAQTFPSSTSSTISGTTLTIAGTVVGSFSVGEIISGTGVTIGTTITALGTGTGGTGTYTISPSQTVSTATAITGGIAVGTSTSSTISGTTLTIGGTITGSFSVGSMIGGTGVAMGTQITALGTGTGGAGTYTVNISQTVSAAISMSGTNLTNFFITDVSTAGTGNLHLVSTAKDVIGKGLAITSGVPVLTDFDGDIRSSGTSPSGPTIGFDEPCSGPALTASASGTTPVCSVGGNSILTLTASTNAGTPTYSWSGPNGFSSTVQNPVINNPVIANSGIYSLTVTNGACSATSTTAIVVNAALRTVQAFNECAGQSVIVGSHTYSLAGSYTDDFWSGAPDGCDKIVFTNLQEIFNPAHNPISFNNAVSPGTNSFTVTAGSGARAVTTADFNNDGKTDLAIANYFGNPTANILLGNGSGGFTTNISVNASGATESVAIAAADFNNDGNQDLLIANGLGGEVSFILGNGNGTFGASTTIQIGSGSAGAQFGAFPIGFVCSDFNRDGKLDFAVACGAADSIFVFFGNGSGGFSPRAPYSIGPGTGAFGLIGADFNNDGIIDFAVPNNGTGNITIMLGKSDGTFNAPGYLSVGQTASGVGIYSADFDGDGNLDLANINQNASGVYVLLGHGDGTFGTATLYPIAGGTDQLGITGGDFNGDGFLDLATANNNSTNISVLFGNGSGGFPSSINFTAGTQPESIVMADFNGDGRPDIAAGNFNNFASSSASVYLSTTPSINTTTATTNNPVCGNGTLTLTPSISTWASYSWIGPAGSGFTSSSQSPSIVNPTSANSGIYTLTMADSHGCSGTTTTAAAVINIVTPVITPTTPVCANSVGNIYSTTTSKTNYAWTITGGNIIGATTNSSSTVTWGASGTGHIKVNYKDINGCSAASPTDVPITINALPTPSISESDNSGSTHNDNKICNLDTVTLSGMPSSGLTYSWSAGLGNNQTVTDNPSVNTTYTLNVIDVNGCTGVTTSSVVVNSLPPVSVTPTSAVCTGQTTATLTAGGASIYTWSPTSNLTPTAGTTATETAQISVLTFYTVTGTDGNQCSKNVIVPVATVAIGGTISPLFSIICSGGTKMLTVTGVAGHDYIWQISGDNATWDTIPGATSTTYTTASVDGNTNKFYRLLARSNSCWNVASTTSEVDVSNPTIAVTASSITDNILILNWSPTGTGNYNITYSGASSGLQTGVTPPKAITGLTANGTYSIVVTQTGLTGCSATGTVSATTLCAVPTNLTATSLTVGVTQELNVNWNGPAGNYRVYYRPLYSAVTFYTKDVTNATSTTLTKQGNNNLYGSNTYQIYVSRLDCPNTGNVGQPTSSIYVTTNPTAVPGCSTPTIDTVFSSCPVLLEVQLHGSTTGNYNVYIQRLTPTLQAVNSYGISSGDLLINASAGQQYLISADSKCGSTVSTLNIWHNYVTVKPTCNAPANPVLSNPTCHGFTASWNADQCISNTISGYDFYMRQVGSINYNSYPVVLPVAPVGPHLIITTIGPGKNMQAFVQSIYNCGGSVTYGPSSQVAIITTLSVGCREEEDAQQPWENKPAVQQYSANNDEVFSLYPNPNTGEFTINLSRLSNNSDEVRIEVINIIGQTVVTQITAINDGHMSEFINLPTGTTAGTYIVRLTAGKNVYTAKVNISK